MQGRDHARRKVGNRGNANDPPCCRAEFQRRFGIRDVFLFVDRDFQPFAWRQFVIKDCRAQTRIVDLGNRDDAEAARTGNSTSDLLRVGMRHHVVILVDNGDDAVESRPKPLDQVRQRVERQIGAGNGAFAVLRRCRRGDARLLETGVYIDVGKFGAAATVGTIEPSPIARIIDFLGTNVGRFRNSRWNVIDVEVMPRLDAALRGILAADNAPRISGAGRYSWDFAECAARANQIDRLHEPAVRKPDVGAIQVGRIPKPKGQGQQQRFRMAPVNDAGRQRCNRFRCQGRAGQCPLDTLLRGGNCVGDVLMRLLQQQVAAGEIT